MKNKKKDFCLFSYPKNSKRVIWEITHRCNLSCKHCCANATFDSKISKLMKNENLLRKRIEEMIDFGIGEYYISGGEPFILKNIFLLLKILKDNNAQIKIATNGTLLNEAKIKRLKKLSIDLIHISIDGPNAEIHNSFRQVKCFRTIIKNIKLLKMHKLNVRVGCILWKGNEKYIENMAKLCMDLGVDELRLGKLISVGRFKEFPEIAPVSKEDFFIKQLKKLQRKYSDKILISMHRNDDDPRTEASKYMGCIGGDKLFFIDAEGKISPCSWLTKAFPEFTSKKNIISNTFVETIKENSLKKFLAVEEKRRSKKIFGCPFIAKLENKSYYK